MKNRPYRNCHCVLGLILLASSPLFSQRHWWSGGHTAASMNSVERQAATELVQEANQDRARYGLPPLRQDPELVEAAWRHAQRMAPAGKLSHDLPGEPNLTVRVQAAGVRCTTVAENIAKAPTASMINDGWMHSPPHRRNLLDPRLNAVGVAVVKVNGELYAVQDFAREVQSLTGSQQEEQVSSLLRKRGLRILPNSAPARSYCNSTPRPTRSSPRLVIKYSTSDLSQLPQQVKHGIGAGKYRSADVGVCGASTQNGFRAYRIVILLY